MLNACMDASEEENAAALGRTHRGSKLVGQGRRDDRIACTHGSLPGLHCAAPVGWGGAAGEGPGAARDAQAGYIEGSARTHTHAHAPQTHCTARHVHACMPGRGASVPGAPRGAHRAGVMRPAHVCKPRQAPCPRPPAGPAPGPTAAEGAAAPRGRAAPRCVTRDGHGPRGGDACLSHISPVICDQATEPRVVRVMLHGATAAAHSIGARCSPQPDVTHTGPQHPAAQRPVPVEWVRRIHPCWRQECCAQTARVYVQGLRAHALPRAPPRRERKGRAEEAGLAHACPGRGQQDSRRARSTPAPLRRPATRRLLAGCRPVRAAGLVLSASGTAFRQDLPPTRPGRSPQACQHAHMPTSSPCVPGCLWVHAPPVGKVRARHLSAAAPHADLLSAQAYFPCLTQTPHSSSKQSESIAGRSS